MGICRVLVVSLALLFAGGYASAEVCNLKVVTDASPDYSDLPSMVHSITSRWPATKEKCWAMFHWNHLARRQTIPMHLHGLALTDPIRQYNDYGYTMCSTIAGMSCAIWNAMGLKAKYWDISLHTVPEVFYDGRWHMYDSSMSALYTLCDGVTIAGVEDIGKEGGCEASGGKVEPGHVARYHCLNATSPNGFLTGADTIRDLEQEYRCFNPKGLKYRPYYYDWDAGHRYVLNLKEGEVYTRYYRSRGADPTFYVPNGDKDPENRYRIRGNGVWTFRPPLTADGYRGAIHSAVNIAPAAGGGLQPSKAGTPAHVVFRVQAANVITSQVIQAALVRQGQEDQASISVSTSNGLKWSEVWKADGTGDLPARVDLLNEVNGAYEVLVRIDLLGATSAAGARLQSLEVQTTTMLNAKTQPSLNLGRNTIYVGAGDPTESIVFWPELQGGRYKELIVEERNVTSTAKHPGYQGTLHPTAANEDAYVVYRMDAPADLTRVTFGGRFYNRAPKSHIGLLYSLDAGKSWRRAWTLTSIEQPWDVIHYETVAIPRGHRSVLLKYLMNTPEPSPGGCSIYAVRMEANYRPADAAFRPMEVTFAWSVRQPDRSLVERSHTQLVEKLPFRYSINVGGADHPVVNSLRVNLRGAVPNAGYGYSDGKDAGGERFVGRWITAGRNLAVGKSYTLSAPSGTNWDAGDPDGKKLTDGIAGPSYAGGTSYRSAAVWSQKTNPVITLDLGTTTRCASFGMNFHGYPWWDALKGQVKDRVEVLVSGDGQEYRSLGFLETDLRWKDIPVNFMVPDDEALTGATFRLTPDQPVTTRYVQYRITSDRIVACTELEVLDSIRLEPFDLRVALPAGR